MSVTEIKPESIRASVGRLSAADFDTSEEQIDDFIFHLQSGIIVTKSPNSTLSSPSRRVLYITPNGHSLNWRSCTLEDYNGNTVQYNADILTTNTLKSASKGKEDLPLSSLGSVQYSTNQFTNDNYYIRLVFDGYRELDFQLRNKEDFEYCMDNFELISKNKTDFHKGGDRRASRSKNYVVEERQREVEAKEKARSDAKNSGAMGKFMYEQVHCNANKEYYPLVINYGPNGEKECGIGCGNDLEDILLIIACYGVLWSFALCFLGILLKGAIDTDEGSTILYMFLGFAILFLIFMILAVQTGQIEKKKKDERRMKMGLESASAGEKEEKEKA